MCKKELIKNKQKYCDVACKNNYYKYIKPYLPEKFQANSNYFQDYSINLARPKGVKGSAGWGYNVNRVWFWTELSEKSLEKYTNPKEKIKLGNGEVITIKTARKRLKILNGEKLQLKQ